MQPNSTLSWRLKPDTCLHVQLVYAYGKHKLWATGVHRLSKEVDWPRLAASRNLGCQGHEVVLTCRAMRRVPQGEAMAQKAAQALATPILVPNRDVWTVIKGVLVSLL